MTKYTDKIMTITVRDKSPDTDSKIVMKTGRHTRARITTVMKTGGNNSPDTLPLYPQSPALPLSRWLAGFQKRGMSDKQTNF